MCDQENVSDCCIVYVPHLQITGRPPETSLWVEDIIGV